VAKRKRNSNYEKMIKEGRGSGEGKNYKPWILIQDVPSIGRSSRIKGITTQRQHDFLSDLERNYFYYLDFSDNVIDIREQFPLLPIEETIMIAEELGIEHPKHPETKEPIVMTTDFLITLINEKGEKILKARTLKYKDELFKKRVLEKFEIERNYFMRNNIDWGIVTENEIDKNISSTIADLYNYQYINEIEGFLDLDKDAFIDIKYYFINKLVDYSGTLRSLCTEFDHNMQLISGSGIALFKHLLIIKELKMNLQNGINFNSHVNVSINETGNLNGDIDK